MNSAEMWELLTVASIIDHRTVDDAMVAAWLEAIGDLTYEEARRALAVHRRTSTEYLLPAHLWRIAEAEPVPEFDATAARLERERRALNG